LKWTLSLFDRLRENELWDIRLFKGKYYWNLTRSIAIKPVSVTVSGVEGKVMAPVP